MLCLVPSIFLLIVQRLVELIVEKPNQVHAPTVESPNSSHLEVVLRIGMLHLPQVHVVGEYYIEY